MLTQDPPQTCHRSEPFCSKPYQSEAYACNWESPGREKTWMQTTLTQIALTQMTLTQMTWTQITGMQTAAQPALPATWTTCMIRAVHAFAIPLLLTNKGSFRLFNNQSIQASQWLALNLPFPGRNTLSCEKAAAEAATPETAKPDRVIQGKSCFSASGDPWPQHCWTRPLCTGTTAGNGGIRNKYRTESLVNSQYRMENPCVLDSYSLERRAANAI